MKKVITYIALFLLSFSLLTGCNSDGEDKQTSAEANDNMYDNLTISTEAFSMEEIEKMHTTITSWAEEYLLVDNNTDSDAVEKAEEKLYDSINSEEDLEKIKADHEELYSDGIVTISKVDVAIKETAKATYEDKDVGKVTCGINVTGQKNGEAFTRDYDLVLVVGLTDDEASVYEVGEISWE